MMGLEANFENLEQNRFRNRRTYGQGNKFFNNSKKSQWDKDLERIKEKNMARARKRYKEELNQDIQLTEEEEPQINAPSAEPDGPQPEEEFSFKDKEGFQVMEISQLPPQFFKAMKEGKSVSEAISQIDEVDCSWLSKEDKEFLMILDDPLKKYSQNGSSCSSLGLRGLFKVGSHFSGSGGSDFSGSD